MIKGSGFRSRLLLGFYLFLSAQSSLNGSLIGAAKHRDSSQASHSAAPSSR